jgi:hypothetical protein
MEANYQMQAYRGISIVPEEIQVIFIENVKD